METPKKFPYCKKEDYCIICGECDTRPSRHWTEDGMICEYCYPKVQKVKQLLLRRLRKSL